MNAVDTNVLIYARDPRDPVKQRKARALTANLTDGALLWQVACEFIAASRKLTEVGYTQAEAWGELEQLRVLWKLIVPSENVLVRAEQLTASPQPFVLGRDDRRGVHGRQHHAPLHGRF